MTTPDAPRETKRPILVLCLLLTAGAVAVLSAVPAVQSKMRGWLRHEERNVLAKITAYYGVEQHQYLILKIQDAFGLTIEIYQEEPATGQQLFRQKFELLHDSDAYITLDKSTTNLALSDADKDGQLDILAPSVDRNGNLRLNAFKFNGSLNVFEPLVENRSE